MSNKPRIYGTCDAGCLWETVHKDDFEKSACIVKVLPNEDGTFSLDVGKTYKIVSGGSTSGGWDFTVKGVATTTYDSSFTCSDGKPAYDKFANGVKFRFCGDMYNATYGVTSLVYEYNDTRYTIDNLYDVAETVKSVAITVSGATAVYIYNEDATIEAVGKSAYEVALDNGFEGSEEEWLASLKAEIEVAQGTGTSESAVMSQGAVTTALEGKLDAVYRHDITLEGGFDYQGTTGYMACTVYSRNNTAWDYSGYECTLTGRATATGIIKTLDGETHTIVGFAKGEGSVSYYIYYLNEDFSVGKFDFYDGEGTFTDTVTQI